VVEIASALASESRALSRTDSSSRTSHSWARALGAIVEKASVLWAASGVAASREIAASGSATPPPPSSSPEEPRPPSSAAPTSATATGTTTSTGFHPN
jgi:hypothetical protein